MREAFWRKSYDPGVSDIDPAAWETTYLEKIRATFDRFAKKPAYQYMGRAVTFKELDEASSRFARMLHQKGLKRGDVVGVNLPNIPEYGIAWLGILKAGCVVSGVSPLLSPEQTRHQLADSRARGL